MEDLEKNPNNISSRVLNVLSSTDENQTVAMLMVAGDNLLDALVSPRSMANVP